jgi:uncharacterized protein (TIGR02147 family)
MIMNTKLPSIFEYSDYRRFLVDYQKALAEVNEDFNKSNLCKKLGLPNTRSFFNDVIDGRKLSSTYVERFIRVLELSKDEAQFFRAMVRFNQAENAEERELFLDQLISLNRTPKRVLDRKAFAFFREWHHSVIRAVLDTMDIRDDFKPLARILHPRITAKQAAESIRLMDALGLIVRNPDGYWRPSDKSVTTSDFLKDDLIRQYQIQCLDLAKQALIRHQKYPHRVTTNIISISEEGYKRIQKRIERFRAEIRSLVHKDNAEADRVYQLNIQLFPSARLQRSPFRA